MKLVCTRQNLADGLSIVGRAVNERSTMPIVGNVLFEVEGGMLILTAYDFEMGIRRSCPVEGELKVTLPASTVRDIINRLPDGMIEIRQEADSSKVVVESGNSRYTVFGLPADDFPALPEVSPELSLELPAVALRSLIRKTAFAASSEETRAVMTGVLLDVGGGWLTAVATDTHRLSRCKVRLLEEVEKRQVIVPARSLMELLRVLDAEGEVRLAVSDTLIQIDVDNVCIVSGVIDGSYPDYKRVVPKVEGEGQIIAAEEFRDSVRRASIVARNNNNKVLLSGNGNTVTVTAESSDVGSAHEEIDVGLVKEEFEVGLNAEYVLDFLNAVNTDEIRVFVTSSMNPVLMKPVGDESFVYVVMPMTV